MSDLAPFMTYAAAMSITPGPNNAMLATLGAQHGWRGAAPAAAGVVAGMFLLLVAAGTGVGAAIAAVPALHGVLTAAGVGYMAYLAWLLWHADGAAKARPPLGFWGAVAFQAVNPKALLMALTAAGGFGLPGGGPVAMAGLFVLVGGPCVALWALVGDRLRRWLEAPARARLFSRGMALLVAGTAVAMVLEA
jgi:threonine/homoserine/homoserine lactone efflux protein